MRERPGLNTYDPHKVINAAVKVYEPVAVFAAFSGGHDSLVSTAIAMANPNVDAVVHINTGIGVEATREFVRTTCEKQGWELIELHPPAGHSYRDIILEHGFPGPAGHLYTYTRLKERPLRQLHASYREKRGDKIMVITGVRSEESTRRMGHVQTVVEESGRIWVAPIHAWTKAQCNQFISEMGYARNEVVDNLHMSGECLCGAFAKPGEMEQLEFFYPEVADRIHKLEHEVRDKGLPWVWGAKPPMKGQEELDMAGLCAKCQI